MKKNWILPMAAALLCLTLISTYLVSGMLARYTTRGTGGDTARTAGFGTLTLTETAGTQQTVNGTTVREFSVLPGVGIAKDPKVTMTASEVAVRVTVEITLPKQWKLGTDNHSFTYPAGADGTLLSWSVVQDWTYLETKTNVNGTKTYHYCQDLVPGAALDSNIIQGNAITMNHNIAYSDYYDIYNTYYDAATQTSAMAMEIQAKAKQID